MWLMYFQLISNCTGGRRNLQGSKHSFVQKVYFAPEVKFYPPCSKPTPRIPAVYLPNPTTFLSSNIVACFIIVFLTRFIYEFNNYPNVTFKQVLYLIE